jgi:hypothetical protein
MATHARTVVPIIPDPWSALATKCQRDAAAIVEAATLRSSADGRTRLTGAIEALVMLYGELMAKNAQLSAEVESLRGQVQRRGWLPRLLGGRGNA